MNSDRVYLVDDDEYARLGIGEMLRPLCDEVHVFADAGEFLRCADLGLPACVLVDLNMPNMGGLDLISELACRGAAQTVVVISGAATVGSAVEAMQLGAATVLEKPVSSETLSSVVVDGMHRAKANFRRLRRQQEVQRTLSSLSQADAETLDQLLAGMANKEIAGNLGISLRGVEARRAKLLRLFGVKSVAQLAVDVTTARSHPK